MKLHVLPQVVPDPDTFRSAPPPAPAVWHMPPAPLARLLSLGDLDSMIGWGVLRSRWISVVRAGRSVPESEYTWPRRQINDGMESVVRAAAITTLLQQGSTVILQSLQRTWRPVATMCRGLSREVGVPVEANAYLTPAHHQGFAHHHDPHSVLIVQTVGTKTWQIHEPVFPDPLEHQNWRPDALGSGDWDRLRHGKPTLETVLHPGDVLWIPRGWIHNAYATTEPSLHITFAFQTLTPYWLAKEVVKELDEVVELRRELPWGAVRDPDRLRETCAEVMEQLGRAMAGLDPDRLADRLVEAMRPRFLEPDRAPVTSALADDLTPGSRVAMVAEALHRRRCLPDGGARLEMADASLTLGPPAARALAEVLESGGDSWCALDLGPELDEAEALEIVTQLIRAGLARRV
ncbi:JmjC domain-containing protein [Wenjunlia tyrosinilytica]|uniref:JmjC domain-containing protein n=1 Tax=Wenjunlia tyrosinilytica TaxID=1544741 RepID=A0A917ZY36_9ACTN|nr:cupin domain-containing protein [Wenjunlia tyrosinilytica]GGP00013.1 hypothetical protein GCM10012280_67780 [Wenjunlia tyrosinilytica]